MLRRWNFGMLLVVMTLFLLVSTTSIFAQEAPGLDVEVTDAGVAVYRLYDDGTRTLITFVPAITDPSSEGTAQTFDDTSFDSEDDFDLDAYIYIYDYEYVDCYDTYFNYQYCYKQPIVLDFYKGAGTVSLDGADVIPFNEDGYLIVNTGSLNVRSGPGVEYTVNTVVHGGAELRVLGKNDAGASWWYVGTDEFVRGWVNAIHVIIRGDLTDVPVIDYQGIIIKPTLYIGWAGNLIYPTLPHEGIAICPLPGRSEFVIVGRSQRSAWYQIEAICADGTPVTGWVPAEIGIVRNPAGTEFPVTDDN